MPSYLWNKIPYPSKKRNGSAQTQLAISTALGASSPPPGLACPPRPGAKSEAKALGQMLSTDLVLSAGDKGCIQGQRCAISPSAPISVLSMWTAASPGGTVGTRLLM